jgi:hypothetical protein
LLGNDLVGVHINPVERGDEGVQVANGMVASLVCAPRNCQWRTSVKCPVTAAAAAIMGLTR